MLKFDTERRGHFAKKYAFIIIEKKPDDKYKNREFVEELTFLSVMLKKEEGNFPFVKLVVSKWKNQRKRRIL